MGGDTVFVWLSAISAIAIPILTYGIYRYTKLSFQEHHQDRFPQLSVKYSHSHHVRISIPELRGFWIEKICLGRGVHGSIRSADYLGADPVTDVDVFTDASRTGRAVILTPPASSAWVKIETSASKPTLDIKIISDRFRSLTRPITLDMT